MLEIKTPCPQCGKRMIKSWFDQTEEYLEIRVRNGCHKCGWSPPQRYFKSETKTPGDRSVSSRIRKLLLKYMGL